MEKIKAGVKAETEDLCQGGFFRVFFNAAGRKHLSPVKRQSYDLEHRQDKVLQIYLYKGHSGQASLLMKKN